MQYVYVCCTTGSSTVLFVHANVHAMPWYHYQGVKGMITILLGEG